MASTPYVALLRGINVGGRTIISMADLRTVFEAGGYGGVQTYIQSGNVVFSTGVPRDRLEGDLESMLEGDLERPLMVVVRSRQEMRTSKPAYQRMTIRSWRTTTRLLTMLEDA